MAGKTAKRKRTGRPRRKVKTWEWVVIGVVAGFAAWQVWEWQRSGATQADFLTLAQQGGPQLSRVVRQASAGIDHLAPGQTISYPDRFPTSGAHDPVPVEPGFYDTVQPPTKLVHSNEHGMVVIYYDKPPAETLEMLKEWTRMFPGIWDGVVVTPAPGIGEEVVLTAWRNILRLDPFDPAAAAAFVDRFRGRGPENPVR